MTNDDEVKTFVECVVQMRKVQKDFFRTRNYALMQQSKVLEKDVDDRAHKLLVRINSELEAEKAAQPDLFSEVQ